MLTILLTFYWSLALHMQIVGHSTHLAIIDKKEVIFHVLGAQACIIVTVQLNTIWSLNLELRHSK